MTKGLNTHRASQKRKKGHYSAPEWHLAMFHQIARAQARRVWCMRMRLWDTRHVHYAHAFGRIWRERVRMCAVLLRSSL